MDQINCDESTVESLRVKIAAHRTGFYRAKHIPLLIRRECVKHLDAGYSTEELARKINVSSRQLYRWNFNVPRFQQDPAIKPRVLSVTPTKKSNISDELVRINIAGITLTLIRRKT